MCRIGSVRRYDDQRTGIATAVKQRHFLSVCNRRKGSSQKNWTVSRQCSRGEAIGLMMQDVHDNNQNTENQKERQQQPFA